MTTGLILASASVVRARLLENAGIPFEICASGVDESYIKQQRAGEKAQEIAMALAVAKAMDVARENADALVIGADQILECEGQLFDKPSDMAGARSHLQNLQGKTHRLLTAASVVREGETIWSHLETPALTMRHLTEGFIDDYLSDVGSAALTSVGAYQLEGRGAQLFDRIDGDFFSILGLPLLPLLAFLRDQSLLPE